VAGRLICRCSRCSLIKQSTGWAIADRAAGGEPSKRELYVPLLLNSRRHAARGIGARLIHRAVEEASQAGCRQRRVDCWAGAPSLIAWHEKNGFQRDGTFELGGWHGQIFNRRRT
jgi:GNAT superfamily N-acetyltransferase